MAGKWVEKGLAAKGRKGHKGDGRKGVNTSRCDLLRVVVSEPECGVRSAGAETKLKRVGLRLGGAGRFGVNATYCE
jgi:hypothetical protein